MKLLSLIALVGAIASASAWSLNGPIPALRSPVSRSGALTICMGRKPANVGKLDRTKTKTKEKTSGKGVVAVIKVKAVTGVDMSKKMLVKKLASATKENMAAEVLNDKVKKFMVEEAGSTMYPKYMAKIKQTASRLGVEVPDKWAYEAKGNAYQRAQLVAKAEAAAAEAAEAAEAAAAAEEEAAPAEEAPAAE
mmetsp:Transcript_1088/g.2780  ORF Transcript_1088/g.2780 Transcript_1088/m.2780 type:complete len:193 (-) Transcript_1088:93-671(-)